jgi:cytochrome c peroxidase
VRYRAPSIEGKAGTRNAPSLLDVGTRTHLFWDGRENKLENAAIQPFTNPVEMGLDSEAQIADRLQADLSYSEQFRKAFPNSRGRISTDQVGRALAVYLRTLPTSSSAYARY